MYYNAIKQSIETKSCNKIVILFDWLFLYSAYLQICNDIDRRRLIRTSSMYVPNAHECPVPRNEIAAHSRTTTIIIWNSLCTFVFVSFCLFSSNINNISQRTLGYPCTFIHTRILSHQSVAESLEYIIKYRNKMAKLRDPPNLIHPSSTHSFIPQPIPSHSLLPN